MAPSHLDRPSWAPRAGRRSAKVPVIAHHLRVPRSSLRGASRAHREANVFCERSIRVRLCSSKARAISKTARKALPSTLSKSLCSCGCSRSSCVTTNSCNGRQNPVQALGVVDVRKKAPVP